MKRYLNSQQGNSAKIKFAGILFILQFLFFNGFGQIEVDHTDVTCTGASDGTAQVTNVSNGTPPYTYTWSTGENTPGISNLAEGDYTVTVVDANGCQGTETVTIELSMSTLGTTMASTPESCDNTADGTATVTASGGSTPYTYEWSNGGTTSTITDLSQGTYSVTVTDSAGCKGTGSVEVEMSYNAFPVTITSSKNPSCHGGSDGTATASASGGDEPYTYTWSNGSGGATASGLAAGTYTVTATDANGCHGRTNVTIGEPAKLTVSVSGGNTVIRYCNGDPTSTTLSATASGGTPPYTYSWPGGTLTVSGSGLYCCSVTDSNGCNASKCVFVLFIPIDCPQDPNIIAGPAGYAEPQWVSVNDQLSYTVWFENDPVFATAPAQEVKINVPLSSKINWNSLQIGNFGFGDFNFSVPANTAHYTTRLDVRDSLNVYVDVVAGLDVVNHEAFWVFRSIDPATGLPPNDPQTGFLPVNDTNTHVGEGFVTFTIKPRSSDITGDSVLAQAKIVFDINESINTNEWFNKIDAKAPASSIDTLIQTSPSSLDIIFSGQDDPGGCGIQKYMLYYSRDAGPYNLFGEYIFGDTAHLSGIENSEYGFFSIAKDNVGNTEPMKNTPEAEVILGYPKSITGSVTYQNLAGTPISNATVYLRNTEGVNLDSVTAGVDGAYDLGLNPQKTYLIDASAVFPWGGVNSTDALLVRRASIGLSVLNRLQDTAADVNHSNTISSTDALLIRRRVVGQIDNFQIKDIVFLKDTIVLADTNITHDIKTLCAGDVNGSFTPVMLKNSGIELFEKGEIFTNRDQNIDLPILCENMIQPAAVTLIIDYPEKFADVEGISSSLPGLLYSARKGKVVIAWDSLSPAVFNSNDVLCVLHLKVSENASEKDNIALSLDAASEFADKTADIMHGVRLSYPDIRITPDLDFELSQNHPNPFRGETEIGYVLPEEGNVLLKAYDVLGQEVGTLVSTVQKAGKYTIRFDGSGLKSGAYYYKITVEGVTRNFNATRSMIIFPGN
ncbi:MAG TPA: T9SS type A sorting domain-containing protein [Bacteroidales bacterium]|nr:T9SS type A sorting domain-containing protein [Bacteroidales bacterium]